jgi:hypothetical protein
MKFLHLQVFWIQIVPLTICFQITANSQEPTRLAEDVNFYRDVIQTKHINAFTRIEKTDFNQRLDSILNITGSLDESHFIVELMKINAMVGDEHTNLFPKSDETLPFKFRLFEEGMTIVATDSNHTGYMYCRVESIDGVPWKQVDSTFRQLIKQDNESFFKFFETYYFSNPQILYGSGIAKSPTTINFGLLSPGGQLIDAFITPVPGSSIKRWIYPEGRHNIFETNAKNSNYWYCFDEQEEVVYFNYVSCTEESSESFADFNKRMFSEIKKKKPRKLILDIRSNGGGNSNVLQPFIRKIAKSDLNDPGRLYILIGRNVMSSALMNVVQLDDMTNATFIGESTGGNINHFGEIQTTELPFTKARLTYSTRYFLLRNEQVGAFEPGIRITESLADFIRSRDRVLEAALDN